MIRNQPPQSQLEPNRLHLYSKFTILPPPLGDNALQYALINDPSWVAEHIKSLTHEQSAHCALTEIINSDTNIWTVVGAREAENSTSKTLCIVPDRADKRGPICIQPRQRSSRATQAQTDPFLVNSNKISCTSHATLQDISTITIVLDWRRTACKSRRCTRIVDQAAN